MRVFTIFFQKILHIVNQSYSCGTNLIHALYHLGELIISRRRSTALLHLPFRISSFRMLITIVCSASSRMYTVGQDTLSTVSLKNVLTARQDALIKGYDFKEILIILSNTSLFKNCREPESILFC